MPTYTSYFNLAKPTVNDPVDADQWGTLLNNDIDSIDGLLRGVTSSKSASFTVQTTEFGQIYLCNATSAAIIATLPSAATAGNGFKVAFKKTDSSANAVTLTPNGSDTIDGAASLSLTTQYSSVVIVSNGTNWSAVYGYSAPSANPQLYYGCALYQTTGTSIPYATWTTILFDTESWDDDGWHSTSSNTERITFNFTGRVAIEASYAPNSIANMSFGLRVRKNGSVYRKVFYGTGVVPAEAYQASIALVMDVVSGDYIDIQGYQNNSTQISGTGIAGTTLSARRIK